MEFTNVKLVAAANVYNDGKVSSRTFYTEKGERKTLGFMMAGEYDFGTAAPELMEMLQGSMDVKLPGESEFKTYGPGESFNIPGNSRFQVRISEFADYCCTYFD
jgi:uncharacterized protein YaiE (UPF0345 family)